MTDTHEAVRLADRLDSWARNYSTTYYTDDMATQAAALLRRIPGLEAEVQEQARLNGMGAERELALRAQVSRLEAERDQLRAELEKVRVPEGWSIYQNGDGPIQATMPNGDKWHFKQNHRPGETAWFAYRLLSAMLTAAPTPPHADQKGAA